MKVCLLILAICTGCGGGTASWAYSSGCSNVESDLKLDQSRLDQNMGTAISFLIEAKLVKDEAEFCRSYGSIPVRILAATEFSCDEYSCLSGENDWLPNSIVLARRSDATFHEYVHAIQQAHLIWNPGNPHEGWFSAGYTKLDKKYETVSTDPTLAE